MMIWRYQNWRNIHLKNSTLSNFFEMHYTVGSFCDTVGSFRDTVKSRFSNINFKSPSIKTKYQLFAKQPCWKYNASWVTVFNVKRMQRNSMNKWQNISSDGLLQSVDIT